MPDRGAADRGCRRAHRAHGAAGSIPPSPGSAGWHRGGVRSERNQVWFGKAEAFGGFQSFSLCIVLGNATRQRQPVLLSSAAPSPCRWGAHVPGVRENAPSPSLSPQLLSRERLMPVPALSPCSGGSCPAPPLSDFYRSTGNWSWASPRKNKPAALIFPVKTKSRSRQVHHGDSPLEQVTHAWNLIELLVFQVQPVPATGTAEGLVSSLTQHISPLLSALYFFP